MEEDAMSTRQVREITCRDESAFEPVVYDYGKTGVMCECGCGTLLMTTPCSRSCPYSCECEDFEQHVALGQYLCPVLREMNE